jgi:hypothetical protein
MARSRLATTTNSDGVEVIEEDCIATGEIVVLGVRWR